MDWEKELFWVLVGIAITVIGGCIGAAINWLSQRRQSISAKAWADYERRRDAYLELVAGIDCLFGSGASSATNDEQKAAWHRAARKVRVVGSDDVVIALNNFTAAVKSNSGDAELRFYDLNLALRRDIRTIHASPPEGTRLEATAFPIEG